MTTEEDLIYTIWDIVRGGETNQDDPINERLMRAFLRAHRGKHLSRAYYNGEALPEEVFQDLGILQLAERSSDFFYQGLPKTIRFNGNYGLKIDLDGFPISILPHDEDLRLARKDRFNKHLPLAVYKGNNIHLYNGKVQGSELENFYGTELNRTVRRIDQGNVSLHVRAVLVNPDDEPGYDFASSPYPMPDELVEDLMNSVQARDFNVFLRTMSDETGDMRNNAKQQPTNEEL